MRSLLLGRLVAPFSSSSSSLAAALKSAMAVQSSSLVLPDESLPLVSDDDASASLVNPTSTSHPSFADRIRVSVAAGSGGMGCCAFDRGANRPKGPPSGGDGGSGGSVLLRGAAGQTPNLATFPRSVRAESGQHGLGSSCHGRAGATRVLTVPLGTVVRWGGADGREEHVLHPNQEILLAAGGQGGRGNASLSRGVRKRRRDALSRHEPGQPGQRVQVELELMTIADVAFVGAPNAGKSTLLRAVSNAAPKVASYPFTTLQPFVGMVHNPDDHSQVQVADLPGLVDGASRNVGLGHRFLRHVARAPTLAYVLDCSQFAAQHPVDVFAMLVREVGLYDDSLLRKRCIVVGTKADEESEAEARLAEVAASVPAEITPPSAYRLVSAHTGAGITELQRALCASRARDVLESL